MTYYQREIIRIKKACYSNQGQLNTVIGTRLYIDDNFDKNISLIALSKVRHTSRFHLLRLFRKYYGQTPKQYLTEKRIEKAKELLRMGASVTDTCFSVGFECPGSFSTLFKSRSGIPPTEFSKKSNFHNA